MYHEEGGEKIQEEPLGPPSIGSAALGVNLTPTLVMTTIFIGEMQMLPMTAYVKMIDVWLVFYHLD